MFDLKNDERNIKKKKKLRVRIIGSSWFFFIYPLSLFLFSSLFLSSSLSAHNIFYFNWFVYSYFSLDFKETIGFYFFK